MFEKLFEPLKIRGMEVKNRIVLPAMGTKMAAEDGAVTQQIIDYQVARVKGGCGLNLSEVCAVHAPSAPRKFLALHNDSYIPSHKAFCDAIHEAGGKCGVQLWQGSLAASMASQAEHRWPVICMCTGIPYRLWMWRRLKRLSPASALRQSVR
mgnify:CR=1 FL=1